MSRASGASEGAARRPQRTTRTAPDTATTRGAAVLDSLLHVVIFTYAFRVLYSNMRDMPGVFQTLANDQGLTKNERYPSAKFPMFWGIHRGLTNC